MFIKLFNIGIDVTVYRIENTLIYDKMYNCINNMYINKVYTIVLSVPKYVT